MASVSKIPKAIAFAILRILLTVLSLYVIAGCALFPVWWKTFIFQGGFLKPYYWRFGFNYLGNEFKAHTPLAVMIMTAVSLIIIYAVFWFGKYSHTNDVKKLNFLKALPPPWWIVICLLFVDCVAIATTSLQNGSYTTMLGGEVVFNRGSDRLAQAMENITKFAAGLKAESEFVPPNSGVYIYLDDRLIIRQFQALQETLPVKSTTESASGETNISGTISLPANIGSVGLAKKTANEKSVTKSVPEMSGAFAATQLIKQFDGQTNTLKWGILSSFGSGSSDWMVAALENRGLKFTDEQRDTLRKADRVSFEKDLTAIHPRQIILYDGEAAIKKEGDEIWIEIKHDGPIRVSAKGILHRESMQDAMVIASETGNLGAIKMMLFLDTAERNTAGDFVFRFTPYAVW